MSPERRRLGWDIPDLGNAKLRLVTNTDTVSTILEDADPGSIHICQGLRGIGIIAQVEAALVDRHMKPWVIMESVDDTGCLGAIKRLVYTLILKRKKNHIEGILAIGHGTPDWLERRGFTRERIFPFAYFLPDCDLSSIQASTEHKAFRFVFAGRLVKRKRLDLLIDALADIRIHDFELLVIGSGQEKEKLKQKAKRCLHERVHWIGPLPMRDVQIQIAQADCLVLPSRYDGWGAVVSEALMRGTPVIVSDGSGSAAVVEESACGGTFAVNNKQSLSVRLKQMIEMGKPSAEQRQELAEWATCLGACAGADYFLRILAYVTGESGPPLPPWVVIKVAQWQE